MSLILVFNHHSLPFSSQSQAKDSVPDFLKLCLKAKRMGYDTILIDETQDPSWFRLELAPGYFFQDWHETVGKQRADLENLRAFRAIATKTPLFSAEDAGSDLALFEVREATLQVEYPALRAAAWYQTPVSSFPTRDPWNRNPISVIVTTLTEEGEHQSDMDIMNWYSSAVLDRMEDILRNERDAAIRSGIDVWMQRHILFPLLHFCGDAPAQIQCQLHSQSILSQVRESLHFMNRFVEKWQSGEITDYSHDALRSVGLPHQVSNESETVRNDPRMRAEREFWLESGQKEFFESHIKLTSGFRIHFFPDSKSLSIHVGYIGRHLRTARSK